ncbi:GNAT family N-acetyltransferase [Sulfitobacter sp. JBTF-M27]|uniref:GNAT family N-acetyltransferase n=1 Tax=Sulfitobacter sediminilitoris TaxID=2698830 RepID=A0A6P0CAK8_9RHOB|nr:GNAT family N-acetyltransferase [Sulfitobacter sediminilitoris]NEK22897.1 GNAT family N-acetyltransferase [Sulfitobacter sediminilitoris]
MSDVAHKTITLPRLAEVSDAPACAAIVRGWLEQTPWMPGGGPDPATLADAIAKGIPEREFWVSGDPVDGYLSLDRENNLIAGLYTAQPGSGSGKALIDAVKHGRDFVQLWTHEANVDAHRFYHREGFVTVQRCAEGRGDGIPELRMEWRA